MGNVSSCCDWLGNTVFWYFVLRIRNGKCARTHLHSIYIKVGQRRTFWWKWLCQYGHRNDVKNPLHKESLKPLFAQERPRVGEIHAKAIVADHSWFRWVRFTSVVSFINQVRDQLIAFIGTLISSYPINGGSSLESFRGECVAVKLIILVFIQELIRTANG